MTSLFGNLAPRFSSNPEDVATEALVYILRRSEAARKEFVSHLERTLDVSVAPDMRFSTRRATGDGGIPDILGKSDGQRVVIEAKFWAGLTERQSEGYRGSLTDEGEDACVFLVPEERVDNIRRKTEGLFESEREAPSIGITHWSAVLDTVETAVRESTEDRKHQVLSDLQQLRGLCERLKAEGFHPIQPDELGPDVARRMIHLRNLVEELREILLDDSGSSWEVTSNMRRRTTVYRFKGEFHGTTFFIGILYNQWKGFEDSPLWVKFRDEMPTRREKIRSFLRPETTVFNHPHKQRDLLTPLELKIGASRDEVVNHLKDQLSTISESLSSLPSKDE